MLRSCNRRCAIRVTCAAALTLAATILSSGSPAAARAQPGTSNGGPSQHLGTIAALQHSFETPPDDAAPMMRWWWFGPSVTHAQLEREMRAMKAGGIGGFEIQPVYPLALDDEATGIRALPFLSDEFLDALRFVSDKARELGLRVDLTLGSGWPFGGPGVPIAAASARLRVDRREVPPGERAVAVPDVAAGERLLAVFVEEVVGGSSPPRRRHLMLPANGRAPIPEDVAGPLGVQFFIASRTGMQVKRAAIGGEGFVLDHYDRRALDGYLNVVGDRLMSAFRGRPPFAVFCDSLEAYRGRLDG